jgi:hypothetical protein
LEKLTSLRRCPSHFSIIAAMKRPTSGHSRPRGGEEESLESPLADRERKRKNGMNKQVVSHRGEGASDDLRESDLV